MNVAQIARRRKAYGVLIALALVLFAVSLLDILALDQQLRLPILAGYGVLLIVGLVLLFGRAEAKRVPADTGEARDGVVKAVDLRCKHCAHVFRLGMERSVRTEDAAFSCPNCGIHSRFPGPDSQAVATEVPLETAWTTLYECSNCSERVVVGTYGRSHHREVRFRPCPHCGQKHTLAPRSSSGTYAEPVEETTESGPTGA